MHKLTETSSVRFPFGFVCCLYYFWKDSFIALCLKIWKGISIGWTRLPSGELTTAHKILQQTTKEKRMQTKPNDENTNFYVVLNQVQSMHTSLNFDLLDNYDHEIVVALVEFLTFYRCVIEYNTLETVIEIFVRSYFYRSLP